MIREEHERQLRVALEWKSIRKKKDLDRCGGKRILRIPGVEDWREAVQDGDR